MSIVVQNPILTINGTTYWVRDLACGQYLVFREAPPSPEWSGKPRWDQIGGPFATGDEAGQWLAAIVK
ncbi:Uncharacterised protein [Mycobacteroides abscessus subsp. abscessus]|jgi:hypothetical protein|uniref:hypothetical protein n=1 Tax=Mycobacteroides abscessus TaxID=36809 RepID=UPI00092B3668|nr:hypothetical protein [Mycobacteroides abscessus]SIH26680.1 Uncharacterised protein [Mycobacteroides abscessus subsp. abscessus]